MTKKGYEQSLDHRKHTSEGLRRYWKEKISASQRAKMNFSDWDNKIFWENKYTKDKVSKNQLRATVGHGCTLADITERLVYFGIPIRPRLEQAVINNRNHIKIVSYNDGYEYFRVYDHPIRGKGYSVYVPVHVLVWEKYHGKYLPKGWIIHHLNGVKNDNRSENLLAMLHRKHSLLIPEYNKRIKTLEEQLAICIEALKQLPNGSMEKVYRSLSMACHPDVGGSNELMSKLNEAYQKVSK